jgi:hypothetical protein
MCGIAAEGEDKIRGGKRRRKGFSFIEEKFERTGFFDAGAWGEGGR